MYGGPALIDLVAYYFVGYVVLPGVAAIATVMKTRVPTKMALIWAIPALVIGAPIAYRVTGPVHMPVLGVWNLAVGPVFAVLLAVAVALIASRVKNPV